MKKIFLLLNILSYMYICLPILHAYFYVWQMALTGFFLYDICSSHFLLMEINWIKCLAHFYRDNNESNSTAICSDFCCLLKYNLCLLYLQLQFLFELPSRLKKCIEMKAYSQAVRYIDILWFKCCKVL